MDLASLRLEMALELLDHTLEEDWKALLHFTSLPTPRRTYPGTGEGLLQLLLQKRAPSGV